MTLSVNQKQAIHPHYSCWVEASAGTGKTKVLTDRVISLLLSGVRIEEILCLTFTKAAGAEMSARIRSRLLEWTTLSDERLTESLTPFLGAKITPEKKQKARQLFFQVLKSTSGIRIQTIHGFCQFLLRSFPLEAGLLPHFQIMDDAQQKPLIEKALQKLWAVLPQETTDFMVRHMSQGQLDGFIGFILSHRHILADSNVTRNNLKAFLKVDREEDPLDNFFHTMPTFSDLSVELPEKATQQDQYLCDVLASLKKTSVSEKKSLYPLYKDVFLTKTGAPRKKICSLLFEKKNTYLMSLLKNEPSRILRVEEQRAEQKCWQYSSLFLNVAGVFLETYAHIKKEHSVIDYDDLIFYGAKLLGQSHIKPWVFEKLDYNFQHVLVDEAQDTSQGQWELLFHLIEEFFGEREKTNRTLFVVGDPKQSIYSFQGASPMGFQKAETLFKQLGNARHVVLSESYRSAPHVLDVVNHVFQKPSQMGVRSDPHQAFRKTAEGSVTLWPLIEEEEEPPKESWVLPTTQTKQFLPRRALAQQIANQISEWLLNKTRLESRKRSIEPRDIMILVRRRDVFMDEIVRALKAKAVPVSGLDRLSLNDHIAVQDVLCLIDVLLLHEDDLRLATLLKSPFFGVSDAKIAALCVRPKGMSLWAALSHHADYKDACDRLTEWGCFLQQVASLEDFFYDILYRQGYRKKFIERLGPDVDDVFSALLESASSFEEQHGPHAALFVSWVRQQNIQIKRNLEGQSENQVRLMTVHAAKGLQAPIVFLPDMTQVPTSKSSFYWKPGYDFFLWADLSVRQFSSKIQDFCSNDQEMEEYYRLLYVALTRAEDHLYLCGWGTKKELPATCWYETLRPVIEKLGNQEKEGFVYGRPPSTPDISTYSVVQKQLIDLPLWVHQPVHVEEPKTMRASSEEVHEKQTDPMFFLPEARTRGVLIHKILQHVMGAETSESVIRDYVAKQTISVSDKDKVTKAVFSVLAHPLFSAKQGFIIKTEISVQGMLNGFSAKGVIDLLMQDDQDKVIWILDYKTGHFDVNFKKYPPETYVRQMDIYKRLLSKIYESYTIKTGLIWTEIGWLQEL